MKFYRFSLALFAACAFLILQVSTAAAKEKWINLTTKNFNIVSNADEGKTRQLGLKLEQFRAVFAKIFNTKTDTSIPVTVVLFKNDDSFKPFKPLYNGKPANVAGYFQQGLDENMIALGISSGESQALATIFHEYTHLLTSQSKYQWPLWVNEGIAEFYSTFTVDKNQVSLGLPIENHVYLLRASKFMPLQNLINVGHNSTEYNERDRQGVFYAQSWALVHYLVLGNNRARQPQLVQFLNLLSTGMEAEKAFAEAFKTDFSVLEKELHRYIGSNTYPITNIDLDSAQGEKDITVRQITEGEAQFHLGNLLLHTNRPDEAENYFKQAITLEPNYNRSYEGLGFIAMRRDRYQEAKDYFKQATAKDSNNYLAHYYFAETLFKEATAGRLAVSSIDPEVSSTIIVGLKRSIELMPRFSHAHYLLGNIYLVSGKNLTEGMQAIKTALQLEPQNKQFALTLAQIQAQMEDYSGAKKTLEPLLVADTDPVVKSAAESLTNWINRASSTRSQPVIPVIEEAGNHSGNVEHTDRPEGIKRDEGVRFKRAPGGISMTGPDTLKFAASSGQADVVKVILERGIDVNIKDDSGRTALSFAAENGQTRIVQILRVASADLNAKDENGKTALIYAAINGHDDTVKMLLDLGVDVNARDNIGETAFIYAAETGRADIVPLLKAGGADVNAKTMTGLTALMYATINGHTEVVKALIATGADLHIKNNVGNTALKYAIEKGRISIAEILKGAGAKR
jgi:tetratricopeptide (TPR) repeat protein